MEEDIESALLDEFDGRATIQELSDYLEESWRKVYSFCDTCTSFLLFESRPQKNSTVVLYESKAKLCYKYASPSGCQRDNCRYFHLCRKYVDYKSCRRRPCQYSHDLGDSHNLWVTREMDLSQYNCKERLIIVRSSNPKVCSNYNSPRGCARSNPGECPDIHVCANRILNRCPWQSQSCKLSHSVYSCGETLSQYVSLRHQEQFLQKLILVLGQNLWNSRDHLEIIESDDDVNPPMADAQNIPMTIMPQNMAIQNCPMAMPGASQPMNTHTPKAFDMVELSPSGELFLRVQSDFQRRMTAQFKITHIYEIRNMTQWMKYQRKKEEMTQLYRGDLSLVDEQQLFHSPDKDVVEFICSHNFDPRLHRLKGVEIGEGIHFSRDASYSLQHTGSSSPKFVFYAKVLTGKKTKGIQGINHAPPVDVSKPAGELFASCVNDICNPSVFVIFERDQCYPEFLIEYQDIVSSKEKDSQTTQTQTTSKLCCCIII